MSSESSRLLDMPNYIKQENLNPLLGKQIEDDDRVQACSKFKSKNTVTKLTPQELEKD